MGDHDRDDGRQQHRLQAFQIIDRRMNMSEEPILQSCIELLHFTLGPDHRNGAMKYRKRRHILSALWPRTPGSAPDAVLRLALDRASDDAAAADNLLVLPAATWRAANAEHQLLQCPARPDRRDTSARRQDR